MLIEQLPGGAVLLTAESKCRQCGAGFFARSSLQAVCSVKCARALVNAKKSADRADTKKRKDALKTRGTWQKDAQQAFNRFIRLRDAHLPCVSCGKPDGGSWDAGHYLTTGARPELRFNEDNCHRQCVRCNQHLHGNLVMYRIGLEIRIGLARLLALEGPHPPAKWTVEDLKEIRRVYREKAKAFELEMA